MAFPALTNTPGYASHVVVQMVEQTVQEKADGGGKALEDMTLDELEALEDEEDERILLQYRSACSLRSAACA